MGGPKDFTPAAIKPAVSTEDLDKLDIRIGTIELVEDVPASAKLVRMRVDFGDHKRTILAGIKKERENPKSEMEGRQALFVVNLPREKWPARNRRACCSISVMPTACCLHWPSRNGGCRTAVAQDDQPGWQLCSSQGGDKTSRIV